MRALTISACLTLTLSAMTPAQASGDNSYINPYNWRNLEKAYYDPPRSTRVDGCSAPKDVKWAISKYQKKFRNACVRHDICYATVGKSRQVCDDSFETNMYKTCSPAEADCKLAARSYWAAVHDHGQPYYQQAQIWAKQHYKHDNRICTTGIYKIDSTGSKHKSFPIKTCDPGYADRMRQFTDINKDSHPDFCRIVGNPGSLKLLCSLSNGSDFNRTVSTGKIDAGFKDRMQMMADVNRDRRADFCRLVGNKDNIKLQCTLSEGDGFNKTISSGKIDPGYNNRMQMMADVNGDHRADFCRLVGNKGNIKLLCTLSEGDGFNKTVSSGKIDPGYNDRMQMMADVNGDGKADFCRIVGNEGNMKLLCNLSNGHGFTETVSTGKIDPGYSAKPSLMVDVDGDGKADFCRTVGGKKKSKFLCRLSAPEHGKLAKKGTVTVEFPVYKGRTFFAPESKNMTLYSL